MKQATIIDKRAVRVSADTFRFERLFPGPIERVWEYLVDGEKRGKWVWWSVDKSRVRALRDALKS